MQPALMSVPPADENLRRRFDRKWVGEPNSGCWLWTAGVTQGTFEYGSIFYAGKTHRAHRLSYLLHVGPVPDGLFVLHSCDTSLCVNPLHLFLGTNDDNIEDMMRKGRQTRGERSASDLAPAVVLAIYNAPGTAREIADHFGLDIWRIRDIRAGKCWRHITQKPAPPGAGEREARCSLFPFGYRASYIQWAE